MPDSSQTPPTQQPVGHSGLYPHQDTSWSVQNGQVMVARVENGSTGTAEPFVFKGVRYQPTPLGVENSLAGSPMGDFFYVGMKKGKGTPKTMMFYEPMWQRDVGPEGLIRKLGANNVGVYGSFNVPPFTLKNGSSGALVSTAAEKPATKWTALGPIRYVSGGGQEYPTYMPEGASAKTPPPYWYHSCHDRFLDICWNNGENPIYVFLAVGVSTLAFFSSNPAVADGYKYTQVQDYYLNTAEWLGKSYGHHPALAGFYVTNETNQPGASGTYQYLEYWEFLNKIGKKLKEGAPHKLTLAAMQDDRSTLTTQLMKYKTVPVLGEAPPATELLYVSGNGHITTKSNGGVNPNLDQPGNVECGAPNPHATAVDVYGLDLWGWNLYAAANDQTPIVSYLKTRKSAGLPMAPVVLSEIGVPQAMRYIDVPGVGMGPLGRNDPYVVNPNGYVALWEKDGQTGNHSLKVKNYISTVLGEESMAVYSAATGGPPPSGFFEDHNIKKAGGLIVYDETGKDYYLYVGDPGSSTWQKLDKNTFGGLLDKLRNAGTMAAGPAVVLSAYLDAAAGYQVGKSSVSASDQIFQGVQVFEYCDEWYKWVDPSITSTSTMETAAGVHDFRDTSITSWGNPPAQFFTTWEEEWFGLCSVLPNGRSSTSRAISTDGWLAGKGPDLLTPRSSYSVVKDHFSS